MIKLTTIPAIAIAGAILTSAPVASFAGDEKHNYQETQAQRDVAALHEASQNQSSQAAPQQASTK